MTAAGLIVAVVDDDAPFRQAIGGLLRAGGFQAQTYASGLELLQRAHLPEIGLLLVDMQLKEMSGLDLVRRLRAVGCQAGVIFVTGKSDAKTQAAIQDENAGLLIKPFDPDELVAMVQAAAASAS
jgi:two-component system nitrate/nitrite response regulator NarP